MVLWIVGLGPVGLGGINRIHAMDIELSYTDPSGVGFNDPTLGLQRRDTFEAAAQFWADRLPAVAGAEPVKIQALFDSNLVCGTLGTTSTFFHYETGGAVQMPVPNTLYPSAFAKALDADVSQLGPDIFIRFNPRYDDGACSNTWYYGSDANSLPGNEFFFYDIVLHEIAHGLGITTQILADGSWPTSTPDVYSTLVWSESLELVLTDMTMAQRAASVVSSINLRWTGRNATERARAVASCGTSCVFSQGRFWLHAPLPFEFGRSVSHIDFSVESNGLKELMVPFTPAGVAKSNELTIPMLRDMGWACAGDCSGDFSVSVGEIISAVSIALGKAPLADCEGGDGDYDGDISVDDLVRSVANALGGCLEGPQTVVVPTAQAQVIVGSGQGIEGQIISIPISVSGVAGAGAAAQLDLLYLDAPLDLVGCTLNVPGGQHAMNHEQLATTAGFSRSRIAVHPDDLSTTVASFADGVVATCDFEIATGAPPGNYDLQVEDESVCDVDGVDFDTTYTDGQIQICPGCGCE